MMNFFLPTSKIRSCTLTILFLFVFIFSCGFLQGATLTVTYSYDKLQRVTSGHFQNGSLESTLSYTYDPLGNILQRSISAQNSTLAGDVNNDGKVTLADAIIALKILNQSPVIGSIASPADVNNDHRIGLAEAIYAMNYSAAPPVGTVVSAGRIWMDRNLGASRVATSSTDAEAYGDLYQWGRDTDGHEKRTSGATTTLSGLNSPGHGNFIRTSSSPYDWRTPQNANLWQGASGVNNPCPAGFRLPTRAEWETERASWGSNNRTGAYNSPLKLVMAGLRFSDSGTVRLNNDGYYWSGTADGSTSFGLFIDPSNSGFSSNYRAHGLSVRCIKD